MRYFLKAMSVLNKNLTLKFQQLPGLILYGTLQKSCIGFLRGDDGCVPQKSADDLKSNAFVECIDSEGVACHVKGNRCVES